VTKTLTQSALPLPLLRRGKVREVYEVDPDHLLLVASDRVSAFDVVMNEVIPHKGAVLTQLSAFWFERLASGFHYSNMGAPSGCALSQIKSTAHPELGAKAELGLEDVR